jgi:cytochrome oxidase assembly protein ShyY1
VVALADLDPVTSFSGMRVGITGRFDAEHEVLVEPRARDGAGGAWVLTPLRPADPADTSVAVVRGWVPAGQRPTPPPAGIVDIVGVLVADARAPDAEVTAGDPPTLAVVDTGALSTHAGYPVRSGWFALTDMQPAGVGQPLPLQVTELPGADVGLNWRNAAYAIQWVAFAGFAIFFWNRFRRDHVDRPVEQETPQ